MFTLWVRQVYFLNKIDEDGWQWIYSCGRRGIMPAYYMPGRGGGYHFTPPIEPYRGLTYKLYEIR